MASLICHVFDVAKQFRLERIVRHWLEYVCNHVDCHKWLSDRNLLETGTNKC